jgi:hypothetical protein
LAASTGEKPPMDAQTFSGILPTPIGLMSRPQFQLPTSSYPATTS